MAETDIADMCVCVCIIFFLPQMGGSGWYLDMQKHSQLLWNLASNQKISGELLDEFLITYVFPKYSIFYYNKYKPMKGKKWK